MTHSGLVDAFTPHPPQRPQVCGARLSRHHCRAIRQGQLRRRNIGARRLGPLGSRRQQRAHGALQRVGRKEQRRGEDRLHHLAGREGQVDGGRRGASRHRPRHHVPPRLEYPHPRRTCSNRSTTSPGSSSSNTARSVRLPNISARSRAPGAGCRPRVGSQVKPCCSRFDLYKEHAGIDLRDMFPADEVEIRTKRRSIRGAGMRISRPLKNFSRPAIPSACRWARPATLSTGSARCSTLTASSWSTPRTTSRLTPTRRVRRWNTSRS